MPMSANPSLNLSYITFLFLIINLHLSFSTSTSKCNLNDMNVLKIKSHFNDTYEKAFNDTWNPKKSGCCTWPGVQCKALGRVTSLSLLLMASYPYHIHSEVGGLPFLESLRLGHHFNALSGAIPSSIGNLTNLRTLDLSANSLSGPIPPTLGRLTHLTSLFLFLNHLSGSIPPSLGQLTSLTTFDLRHNHLSGPIPSSLGQLTNLNSFDLSNNLLSGPIPPSLGQLTKLTLLNLRGNNLTGSIPCSFGSFRNPKMIFSFSQNSLSGPVPSSLGQAHLSELHLGLNNLSGDASFFFGRDKTGLQNIDLNYNQFNFDFSKVEFPVELKYLYIYSNQIYGSLLEQLGQLSLKDIDVSNNRLCGPIPKGLWRFGPEKFVHNKCLCGIPLAPCK